MLRGITPKSVLEHLLFAVIGGWLYMAIEVMWARLHALVDGRSRWRVLCGSWLAE